MKRNSKIILSAVAVLLIMVAIAGYYMYNKGPVNVKNSNGIQATPDQLYTSYTTDSIAAHKKFDDKVVKITGVITDISENTQKQQVVLLKTSSSGGFINCTMDTYSSVKPGEQVTIKGICNGLGQGDPDLGILGDVYLTRAVMAD